MSHFARSIDEGSHQLAHGAGKADPYVLRRADGHERKVAGFRLSRKPEDLAIFMPSVHKDEELPPKVDLRTFMSPVEDQGGVNSCTANATAGAYEYLVKRFMGTEGYDVSRLFIYYCARVKDTGGDKTASVEDEGSAIISAIDSLKEAGACSEVTWPYSEEPEVVNSTPSDEAFEEAKQFTVHATQEVRTDLRLWKHCLAEGNPIIFGLMLYESFDMQRKKGLVPMPSEAECGRESHGAHAMLCVGYSDADQVFIVRNSWGPDWGDQGYCYIPYNYIISKKHNLNQNFIIRRLDNPPGFEENAAEDADPVVENLESELANMTEEAYRAMLDDMHPYPLEFRMALLLLKAANADGELSDEEIDGITGYMEEILKQLGVYNMSAGKIMRRAKAKLMDRTLVEESIRLMGVHLSNAMLTKILADVSALAGADELSRAEARFVRKLARAWDVEQA